MGDESFLLSFNASALGVPSRENGLDYFGRPSQTQKTILLERKSEKGSQVMQTQLGLKNPPKWVEVTRPLALVYSALTHDEHVSQVRCWTRGE